MRILIIGTGAREHALAWKLAQSLNVTLFNFGPTYNPGIGGLVEEVGRGDVADVASIVAYAQDQKIDIVWVGPEAPLAAGVVDALHGVGIGCVGPTQELAQLESSKSFTRDLLAKHNVDASPKYKHFSTIKGVREFMEQDLAGEVVVKPDGLTGGKGVRVMGDQLTTVDEAIAYCEELFAVGAEQVLLEEKMVGQEFSLMSFADGIHIVHMPVVQDHKRAYVNDEGPNTGGMGSYTMPDHSLPFITKADVRRAQEINEATMSALKDEYGVEYKGILYGGFFAVKDGVRLTEYNARFGDPEAMNLLSLLESDLVEITKAIVGGTLDMVDVKFSHQASVCKYMVPEGYPDKPVKDQVINVGFVDTTTVNMFYASVDETDEGLIEKGSRTVGIVGIADTLEEAEKKAEAEIQKIEGPLFHREDIGTAPLIEERTVMMNDLRK